jgi:lipopolysaccharide transport system ATP-binding protein
VGDAAFQKKCLGKMSDVAGEGRTVLFVSHNMGAILQLCSRGIMLENGFLLLAEDVQKSVDYYLQSSISANNHQYDVESTPRHYLGTQDARIQYIRLAKDSALFQADEQIKFYIRIKALTSVNVVRFSLTIFTSIGTPIGSCFSPDFSCRLECGAVSEFEVTLSLPRLAPGRYHCGVAVGKGNNKVGHTDYDVVMNVLGFEVRPMEGSDATVAHWAPGWGHLIMNDLVASQISAQGKVS